MVFSFNWPESQTVLISMVDILTMVDIKIWRQKVFGFLKKHSTLGYDQCFFLILNQCMEILYYWKFTESKYTKACNEKNRAFVDSQGGCF